MNSPMGIIKDPHNSKRCKYAECKRKAFINLKNVRLHQIKKYHSVLNVVSNILPINRRVIYISCHYFSFNILITYVTDYIKEIKTIFWYFCTLLGIFFFYEKINFFIAFNELIGLYIQ